MAFFRGSNHFSHDSPSRTGILLVNIGTPVAPTYGAVRRYLARFLGDRRVVDLPPLLWLPLLHGLILTTRPLRSARKYRKIWTPAGSPLLVESRRLQQELQALLDPAGAKLRVELGMSYSVPFVDEALDRLIRASCQRIVVVPLYPQYCSSTVGAVHDSVMRSLARRRWVPDMRFLMSYHDHPDYIELLARQTQETLARAPDDAHLVVSFHGIPVRYITEGDPYLCHCQKMARLLAERLGLPAARWSIAFQSRFGPAAWLQPYADRVLRDLARQGRRDVVLLSPSFPMDCLETLEEVDLEYQREFRAAGGRQLWRVPALNGTQAHALALGRVVADANADWVPRSSFRDESSVAAAG